MRPREARLSALVLAGGQARRLGGEKARRKLGGASLLEHTLTLARAVADDVLLLPGSRGALLPIPADVRVLPDWPGGTGPLGALGAGLEAAARAWCLLLPCDMPFVTRAAVEMLARARPALGEPEQVVALRSSGGLEPFLALYQRQCLPALRAYLASGRRSLRGFLEALPVREVPAADLGPGAAQAGLLCNVNTPADLAAARTA